MLRPIRSYVAGWAAVLVAAAAVSACGWVAPAGAAPVVWDAGNGHAYEFVHTGGRAFHAAATADAAARTYLGVPGHLATITSDAERLFLLSNLPTPTGYSYTLGATQAAGAATPSDGWQWVTGEPWSYTAWAPAATPASGPEPNDSGPGPGSIGVENGDEQFVHMFAGTFQFGFWNDGQDGSAFNYIVEYPVPEPGTATLAGLGAAGLLRRRRRSAAVPD